MTWFPLLDVAALENGEPRSVEMPGDIIALYQIGGEVFATSDICPHGNARLSEGWLSGHTIECPLHQALFDVRDGSLIDGPNCPGVRSYTVRVSNGVVELKMEL